ncbi:sugar ABC transporter substrate-binding protein [Glutamicibacter uratoxydans]|uniref:sugar ABC transporter substrate-binding protein n=1 Tax=Glutamicibacter uratoxydans TaxID=43667 RepID=UPI003D6EE650
MKRTPLATAAIVFAASTLALSACGSDTTNTSTTSGTELGADAQAALDQSFEGISGDLQLDPVNVSQDVNLFVVSCGEQVPGCSTPAANVVEAGKAIGWKTTITDGKLNPEGFATAIRQAIAGGADVIVPIGIGCGVAQAAFQEANDAGITVIGGGGVDDCSPKLWDSERLWIDGETPESQWRGFGKLQAEYLTGKTNQQVKAVVLNFTGQSWGPWITEGFTERLTELGGGDVVATVDVSDPEQADGSYLQKVSTALLNHPEANAVVVPVDGWLATGLAQTIVQSGRDSELFVIGRGGDAPVMDMIRQGDAGVDASVGFAVRWGAWGSVDTAARILDGQPAAWIGESIQTIDAEHNLPDSGDYDGAIDFESVFLEAWGK